MAELPSKTLSASAGGTVVGLAALVADYLRGDECAETILQLQTQYQDSLSQIVEALAK